MVTRGHENWIGDGAIGGRPVGNPPILPFVPGERHPCYTWACGSGATTSPPAKDSNRAMKCKRLAVYLALATICCGVARATSDPAPAAPQNTAPTDLTTGKIDSSPITLTPNGPESFVPQSPPQTVEGTLVSIDKPGQYAVVKTLRDGEVKIGLPQGIILSRDGRTEGCTLDDIKPGDRVYATVVTANGIRAIRLVSEGPANPMVNYVGIPLLCLMALVIWRIRCAPLAGAAPRAPAAKTA